MLTTNYFCLEPGTKNFHAEISELPLPRIPQSLALESGKTRNVASFELVGASRDADGDVRFWSYRPTLGAISAYPRLRGYTLTIWND